MKRIKRGSNLDGAPRPALPAAGNAVLNPSRSRPGRWPGLTAANSAAAAAEDEQITCRNRCLGMTFVGCMALGGCSEHRPLPDLTWSGEFLKFGSEPPIETLCGGTLPYMDAYIGTLRELFGDASDEKVRYYYVDGPLGAYTDGCFDERLVGCTRGRRILALSVPFEHELVHAVFADREPAHLLIEEGTAVLWGGQHFYPSPEDESDVVDVAKSASDGALEWEHYALAGHFMAFLVRDLGVDAVTDIAHRTAWPAWSYANLDAAFREVSGQDLATTAAQYRREFPSCAFANFREPVHACSDVQHEVRATKSATIEVELACSSEEVVGVEDGRMWVEVAVDIVDPGYYAVVVSESEDIKQSFVTMRPCAGACEAHAWRKYDAFSDTTPRYIKHHDAGRYVLRFVRPADRPGRMTVELQAYEGESENADRASP